MPVEAKSLPSEMMITDESEVSILVTKKKSLRSKYRRRQKLKKGEMIELTFEGKGRWRLLVFNTSYQQIFNFMSPQHVFFTSDILSDAYFLPPEEEFWFLLQHPEELNAKAIKHPTSVNEVKNEVEDRSIIIDEREIEGEMIKKREMVEQEATAQKLKIIDVRPSKMINGIQNLEMEVDERDNLYLISTNKSFHISNHSIEITYNQSKKTWKTDVRGEAVSTLALNGFQGGGKLSIKEDLTGVTLDQSHILPFYIVITARNEMIMNLV